MCCCLVKYWFQQLILPWSRVLRNGMFGLDDVEVHVSNVGMFAVS